MSKDYSTLSRRKLSKFIKITHNKIEKIKSIIDYLTRKGTNTWGVEYTGDPQTIAEYQVDLANQESKLRTLVSELMERDMLEKS